MKLSLKLLGRAASFLLLAPSLPCMLLYPPWHTKMIFTTVFLWTCLLDWELLGQQSFVFVSPGTSATMVLSSVTSYLMDEWLYVTYDGNTNNRVIHYSVHNE